MPLDRCLSDFHPLLRLLPSSRQAQIGRFVRREDALRALHGDWLSRTLLSTRLGVPFEDVAITRDAFGKPHLASGALHFNVSHSGCWVAAAIGTSPVGVDVEEIRPIDLDVAETVFSRDEMAHLHSLPAEERLLFFYRLWTIKESFIKAVGKGFSLSIGEFTVTLGGEKISITGPMEGPRFFRQYSLGAEYPLAACGEEECFADNITVLKL